MYQNQKKKKKNNNLLTNLLIILLLIVALFAGYHSIKVLLETKKDADVEHETKLTSIVVNPETDDSDVQTYAERFAEMKEKNKDFLGWIRWESDLINQPIVQSKTDDYYLRRNFNGDYSDTGTAFVDTYQSMNDKMFSIYGHYVYANTSLMFSALTDVMRKPENYENNKYFHIYLEDEDWKYVVAYVVEYSVNDPAYYQMSAEYEPKMLSYAREHEYYNTNVDVADDDNIVVLQTCIRGHKDLRTLVIGKRIGVTKLQNTDFTTESNGASGLIVNPD